MSLSDTFYQNLLKEFGGLQEFPSSRGTRHIKVVTASSLQKIFSLLASGMDVLLVSEEQFTKTGAYSWREEQEERRWGRVLLLTSGTSGSPRIIVHSLEELLKSADTTLRFYGVDEKDVWPLSLPLYHIGGFQIVLRCILAGIPLRFYRKGGPDGATMLSLVPTQWVRLLADEKNWDALKKMKAILIGGAPVTDGLWREAVDGGFPLSPTYGLTEMGSQVAALGPKEFLQRKRGLEILPGRNVEICNGRIVLSGVGQMLGFYEDGVLAKSGEDVITADRGIFNGGRLEVLGRADRIIISGGKKIEPGRLESLLLEHPWIEEAVLLGLPDPFWGERLHLAYVGAPQLCIEDIKKFLHSRVASWEIPKGISHYSFLPKKGGFKPDYGQITQMIQVD